MPDLLRTPLLLFLLLAAPALAGCDGDVNFQPEIDFGDPEVERKVEGLETEVARLQAEAAQHQTEAERLKADVARLQEENVILATDDGFTFRLNTQAAVVLVFAILGLTTFFVTRMRYASQAAPREDGLQEP